MPEIPLRAQSTSVPRFGPQTSTIISVINRGGQGKCVQDAVPVRHAGSAGPVCLTLIKLHDWQSYSADQLANP
jgi:hypothetical protein